MTFQRHFNLAITPQNLPKPILKNSLTFHFLVYWGSVCLPSQYCYCKSIPMLELLKFWVSSITVLLLSRFFLTGVDDIKCPFPNVTIWIFCKSQDISTWNLHRALHRDLARREWGLNPWSSVYETDALPLGHHASEITKTNLEKKFNFSFSCLLRFGMSSFTVLLL